MAPTTNRRCGVERGSNKKNAQLDDQMKSETEPLVRANQEAHAAAWLQKEEPTDADEGEFDEPAPAGHRISGTGSSARAGEESTGRTDLGPDDADRGDP